MIRAVNISDSPIHRGDDGTHEKRYTREAKKTPIRDAILAMIKENPQLWQKALDRFAKLKPAKKAGRKRSREPQKGREAAALTARPQTSSGLLRPDQLPCFSWLRASPAHS